MAILCLACQHIPLAVVDGPHPVVAVARVVHHALEDSPRLKREALEIRVRHLAVPALAPVLAVAVAHDEISAARILRSVLVPGEQDAVPPLPRDDALQMPVHFPRGRERERAVVAPLERVHRHAHRHRTPPVRAHQDAAYLVDVVRCSEQVESGQHAPLLRVIVRSWREYDALPLAEHRRRRRSRVWPQRVSADAPRLDRLEAAHQQGSALLVEACARTFLEPLQVRLHRRLVHAAVGVRHHGQLLELRVERRLERSVERLSRTNTRKVALEPCALDLLRRRIEVLHAKAGLAVAVVLEKRSDRVRHARPAQRLLVDDWRHPVEERRRRRRTPLRRMVPSALQRPQVFRLEWRKDVGLSCHYLQLPPAVPETE